MVHAGAYELSQYYANKDFGVVFPPYVCLLQRLCGKLPTARCLHDWMEEEKVD